MAEKMLLPPVGRKEIKAVTCRHINLIYPNTIGLKVRVQTQKLGLTPGISIVESNHPLFLEQENGVRMDRVISFAKKILYGH
jgi:hypothetical protein